LNYAEQGDPNGIPIVLLHGITDSLHSFSRMMPLMDSKYHVYALDQRGHGDSDKPESGYEMKDFAADLIAFMDAKNIKKASIIGHSMGSFVAIQTAFQAPERVDRLMLIGSATTADNEVTRELRKTVDTLQDPVPVNFVREFQSGAVHAPLPNGFFEKAVAESMKVPARVWKAALAGCMSANLLEKLPKVTAVTLVIWGEKDAIFPRSEQDLLVNRLPKGMIQVYPVTGHSPNWEHPQQVVSNLSVFIPVSD
jgi:pimeloyl-ACP methyl ester carboxylesterase